MATSKNLNIIRFASVLMMLLIFSSCAQKATPTVDAPPAGSVPVTVLDYSELDGCTFILELADGQKLQPVNLSEEFKKKGLKLYVSYKVSDGMSVCMAGRMVTLTSVTLAKEGK